jgi:glycine cleavage system H lipoate-binding protein/TusA-related sulfurtransferase
LKIHDCEFPDALLYDVENGTWARLEVGILKLGITALLSWTAGPISTITFKQVGIEVRRGQVLGSFEGPKYFGVVRSPLSGVLFETNVGLLANPKLMNRDGYGDGWFARVRLDSIEDLRTLNRLPGAAPLIATALVERRVHCYAEFPDQEMFEIGVECAAVLVRLNELLASSPPGTVVHVVSDDKTADIEMKRWSDETGNTVVESKREGDLYHFIVKKSG